MKIVCGKADNVIFNNLKPIKKKPYRIFSENPNKRKNWIFTPIATDGKVIIYKGDTYEIDAFSQSSFKDKKFIVLTYKEKNLLFNFPSCLNLNISILENDFPIFTDVKYINNAFSNYVKLLEKLKYIKKKGWKEKTLTSHFSIRQKYKMERSLKNKSYLDPFFYFYPHRGYQEVFKFKEEREGRVVVAFDFNSMYPSCLEGDFLKPSAIQYKSLRNTNTEYELLPNGLYRVIFSQPLNTFFKDFHPFKFNKFNKSFYFKLDEKDSVEVLVFKAELDYYKQFFKKIELVEVFYSNSTVKHPLYKDAVRTYKERNGFKSQNNKRDEKSQKLKLLTMHSSTISKIKKRSKFPLLTDLLSYIENNYAINFDPKMTDLEKLHLVLASYQFKVMNNSKDEWVLDSPDISHPSVVYSIGAEILSKVKLKILKTIDLFLESPSVEICYSNVDSIHVSIKKKELNSFLNKNKNIISDKLGDMKIQSITSSGYWFDVGRYWLVDNNEVIQHKNILFNNAFSTSAFVKHRKIQQVVRGELFNYTKMVYISLENSFSYSKRLSLDKKNFNRYSFSEIKNISVASDTYCNEILFNKTEKISSFERLATS